MNRTITVVLLAAATAFLLYVGSGASFKLILAIFIAIAINFLAWCFEGRVILWAHSAREIGETDAPPLHRIVRELTASARMPMPKIYLIPQETPNTFAVGRGPCRAAVAVTTGLLHIVDRRTVAARIAPELAHIRGRDALLTTMAVPIAAALSVIARSLLWGTLLGGDSAGERQDGIRLGSLSGTVLAPILAVAAKLAICRSRELIVGMGARIPGDPRERASIGAVPH